MSAYQEYTIPTLREELKARGKNLGDETVKKLLNTGKFGPVEHTGGRSCRRFFLKSEAVDNFIKSYQKSEPSDDVKKIIVRQHTKDGARELATSKVEDDIKRGAPWVKEADALGPEGRAEEIENMITRYEDILLQKYTEIPEESINIEEILEVIRMPQDTLNYAETRYDNTTTRDYFISRYFGFFKHNNLEILNPIHDALVRFIIDDEIMINELRTRIALTLGNSKDDIASRALIHETLSNVTDRWLKNIGAIGLKAKAGQATTPKDETKGDDKKEPKGPELVSPERAQHNSDKIR